MRLCDKLACYEDDIMFRILYAFLTNFLESV